MKAKIETWMLATGVQVVDEQQNGELTAQKVAEIIAQNAPEAAKTQDREAS